VCTWSGEGTEYIEKKWQENVVAPAIAEGVKPPTLIKLQSPYRQLFGSLTDFISQLETDHPNRKIAVVIPSMVEQKWYQAFLHNQRSILLQAVLRMRADKRVVIISVPWYLDTE